MVAVVVTLVLASFSFSPASASAAQLEILSVIYPSQVPYDKTIPVGVVVSFAGNFTPTVSVFYWIISNSTSVGGGWRVVEANPISIIPAQGIATYSASLPSIAFGDTLAYGMSIVFWVEAVSGSIMNSTAHAPGLWNPNDLEGKFLVQVTDPYPPTIQYISHSLTQPTSVDSVTVEAAFPMNGISAPVTQAQLMYTVNGSEPATTLNMTQSSAMTQPTASVFEATIPAQGTGSHVSYSVTGTDAAGYSVQSSWNSYQVSPSLTEIQQAKQEQAASATRLEIGGGVTAAAIIISLAVLFYRRRSQVRSGIRSLAAKAPSAYNAFTASVILSIAVVASAAFLILQFGHAWLALAALLVIVELWGLADPRVSSIFGIVKAPRSGLPGGIFEAFRTPGAPLLVSAYTLVFLETFLALLLNVGGFIDRTGLLAIMHFFATYALIMVLLAAVVRYLSYAFSPTKSSS